MTTPTQEALAALDWITVFALSHCTERDKTNEVMSYLATIRAALEDGGRDAERWRWIKENHGYEHDGPSNWKLYTLTPLSPKDGLDRALDAAIARAAEGG